MEQCVLACHRCHCYQSYDCPSLIHAVHCHRSCPLVMHFDTSDSSLATAPSLTMLFLPLAMAGVIASFAHHQFDDALAY